MAKRLWLIAALAVLATPFGAVADGRVERAHFTSGIEGHEPVDRVENLEPDADRVFYFTELVGMDGERVVHRWEYRGEMMAEVAFRVEGPRWRVWSSKRLIPRWQGTWRAVVTDGAGQVLAEERFVYGEPSGDK
ncbi:MAG TPA: DUF2914 domain-containing protein [Gammaproteobacteria bacterium]|nr:DUF2914 domain-containing protein [Gammaproteobacteria bacterium]